MVVLSRHGFSFLPISTTIFVFVFFPLLHHCFLIAMSSFSTCFIILLLLACSHISCFKHETRNVLFKHVFWRLYCWLICPLYKRLWFLVSLCLACFIFHCHPTHGFIICSYYLLFINNCILFDCCFPFLVLVL